MTRLLRRQFASALLVFQLLVCTWHARAQTAADRETARLLMDRGDEQVERGDFEAALTLYLGAHDIMHVPTTGIEVARTYNALGKLVESRDSALEVLRMPVSGSEPRPFIVAREAAAQLATELETLIPVLSIEIIPTTAIENASLLIDGNAIPRAAVNLPHALNPTIHRIHLSARGFHDVDQSVTLVAKEHRVFRIELQPLPAIAEPSPRVVIPPLEDRPRSVTRRSSAWVWPMWAGVGLGGAGIVVGSIAGVASLEHASSAKKFCEGNTCTPEAQSDRDASLSAARVSNVGFGVAGVGALVAVASWWMTTRTASRTPYTASVTFSATPNSGMLHVLEAW